MKPVYWRPKKVAASTTFLIGLGAVIALAAVEISPSLTAPNDQKEKLAANQLAQFCRNRIWDLRRERGLKVNHLFDPTDSGMIGTTMSSITSKPASLDAKQISIHPQFPSAIVQMLRDAGIKNGDTVAVGWTGSFPGLNVALASAMEVLELRPVIVASITASQYGANEPSLTWLDMETCLCDSGLIECQSIAATIGGPGDCGKGMSVESKRDAFAAIKRNNVRQLKVNRLSKSIDARMRLLNKKAGASRIAAYINVGGGAASCGGEDCVFTAGLGEQKDEPLVDCLMQRYSDQGLPILHLAHPRTIARRFGLSANPETWNASAATHRANIGPSKVGAFVVFVLLCLVLQAFILKDSGNKIANGIWCRLQDRPPLRTVGQPEGPQLMV